MNISQNIELFQELVRCGGDVCTWCYDGNGDLLSSNCQAEAVFDTAFSLFGCKERMLAQGAAQDFPIMLGTELGMIWGAAFEKREENMYRTYVLGPVFFSDTAMHEIRDGLALYQEREVSIAWKSRFFEYLPQVPVTQYIIFSRYLLMLHYCLTGEHIHASDLMNIRSELTARPAGRPYKDRYRVWTAERAMLQMVKNGDLNYKQALHNSSMLSNGVPLQSNAPLRQAKTSVTVFCSIVCRAAMEGGLSPEEAYSLGDAYIQSAESAKTYDELTAISGMMYDDFIHRVRRCRTNPKFSEPVQKCCDYIELNLEKRICAAELADLTGYSEYYITRKFREETGFFLNNYIRFVKIERAKLLLSSTDLSILEIAEQLGFATRSYFSQAFRAVTSMTPTEFREKCP